MDLSPMAVSFVALSDGAAETRAGVDEKTRISPIRKLTVFFMQVPKVQ
jgi:hypothetical protein